MSQFKAKCRKNLKIVKHLLKMLELVNQQFILKLVFMFEKIPSFEQLKFIIALF